MGSVAQNDRSRHLTSMQLEDLEARLLRCDDEFSRSLPDGARFVRRLPQQGTLAFLDCLYAPASADTQKHAATQLGRDLPAQVIKFLGWSNGATLFDNAVAIYGYVEHLSRSVELEARSAISLTGENEAFAAAQPARWNAGWMRIDSLVGWSTRLSLQVHESGGCSVNAVNGPSD